MRFVRVAAGALAVFALGMAVALGLALTYQWAYARYVWPLRVVPIRIELPAPELSLTT